eukprot:COSAG02_NODE_15097_length_1204_cov_1.904977_1_plen_141_part_00
MANTMLTRMQGIARILANQTCTPNIVAANEQAKYYQKDTATTIKVPLSFSFTGISNSGTGTFTVIDNSSQAYTGDWKITGDLLELTPLSSGLWERFFDERDGSKVALAFGYGITATGFVLFYGPASAATLSADACTEGQN